MPLALQAKLLRVLQERRFERLGGSAAIEVDVRVIAATNRRLPKLVRLGKFREDLYYRLNVIKIDLPPLRDRPEDVPLLATHFAEKHARRGEAAKAIAPEAMDLLLKHRWRGNIRELENALEHACVTARGPSITPEDLPAELRETHHDGPAQRIDLARSLPRLLHDMTENVERQYLIQALKKSRGNVGRCARICGMSRRSVSAKLAQYGIKKEPFKGE